MLNTQIYDIVHTSPVTKSYTAGSGRGTSGSTSVHGEPGNYDSVSITQAGDAHSCFRKEMVSRISAQIRTSTTTGKIQELRQQVMDHTYHPDPAKIAKSILFQLEG